MKKPKPPPVMIAPPTPPPPFLSRSGTAALNSLTQGIRDKVSHQRFEIAKTIAELDGWRNEIDATIAFLRAQRGEPK
jgi:hypothetical protein